MRSQVAHSNVRTSIPRSPAETRANPILCLQTGHIGRSIMEIELRITLHPLKPYAFQQNFIVRQPTLESEILPQASSASAVACGVPARTVDQLDDLLLGRIGDDDPMSMSVYS
jgi:hypothetical protein